MRHRQEQQLGFVKQEFKVQDLVLATQVVV